MKKLSTSILSFLIGFVLLLGGYTLDEKKVSEPPDKPNIIIVLLDDMGYGDIRAYNKDSKIPTPNLDNFAREGMRFTNAHSSAAFCIPSRYALLTGRYPFRKDDFRWQKHPLIEENRMTIASLLQSEGYKTAMVGKWHLGFEETDNFDQSLNGGPIDRGFDTYFGIRGSTDQPPYFLIRDNTAVQPPTGHIEAGNSINKGYSPLQGEFWRGGGIAPDLELIEVLPKWFDESFSIIRNHKDSETEQPLFLYLALTAPHAPWLPTNLFKDKSEAGMYGDFVVMIDTLIGQLFEVLENSEMYDNTLLLITSDNGPHWSERDIQRFDHHAQNGLRGLKGDIYEAGHRIPFIVRWPGIVKSGTVTSQIVSFTDLLATFADLVDRDLPEHVGEDSFSILSLLSGKHPENISVRPPIISYTSHNRAIQDRKWKLIEYQGSGGFLNPINGGYLNGSSIKNHSEGQLYNLEEDLNETNNLWNDHPDVVDRLMNTLDEYEKNGRSRP